jgi:tryptophan synthase alpha chain
LKNIFLITPQTSVERIHLLIVFSDGFIYMVSSAGVTGSQTGFGSAQEDYFKRAEHESKKSTSNRIWNQQQKTFEQATQFAKGAIIGSAFIQDLTKNGTGKIDAFVDAFDKPFLY